MSTTLRRSRFEVDRRGGDYAITRSHVAILSLFDVYEHLPSSYICALVPWLNPIYVKNVLTVMRHELGLLEVPPQSWQAANARYRPAVYRRTQKGTRALIERGHPTFDVRSGEEFKHAFGVNLIAASLDLGARAHNLTRISDTEILDHPACPDTTRLSADPFRINASFSYKGRNGKQIEVENAQIIHDGYPGGFANSIDGKMLRVFLGGLEFDRNSEPMEPDDYMRPSIIKKFAQILELCKAENVGTKKKPDWVDGYREHYGIENAVIPFWTINETHMKNMMQVLHRITNGKGSDRILFGHMNDFTTFEKIPEANGWALTCNYKRVGFEDYNFLKELGVQIA